MFRLVLIVLFSCFLTACQQPKQEIKTEVMAVERNMVSYLEQDYAAMRAKQINHVSYKLSFDLDDASSSYSGEVIIDFKLAKQNVSPVTIDFNSGKVKAIYLNGKSVEFTYEQYFIQLPASLFKQEKNHLRITFEHDYSNAGAGLHRYQDPESNRVYLFSNFEPYDANKMFPHFDQPNIKASFELSALVPSDWQVVSTTRESSISDDKNKKLWKFPASEKISSYVFSLHAGPYQVWEDNSGKIPLRLFARQEIAKYVNAPEWFGYTQESFSFYNDYFKLIYPFEKYDQLIVPDFNAGAMENVGAVTFNEIYVGRGAKTRLERFRQANVISHEMAHMWFGDLVTMNWWNGLWLNESFATYMSYLQQSKQSEFKEDAWGLFYNNMKQWAYTTDQQVTTHAIELPVANTAEAFTNFDGITYGKGASVLKQLAYFVGEDNFRNGVANYLKKYSYGNSELGNFMDEVALAGNKDLKGWTQEWLYQAGLNTIQVDFACGDTQDVAPLSKFSVLQSAPTDHPTLRTQKIELGFYQVDTSINQQSIFQTDVIPFVYSGTRTELNLKKNTACPDFVYPNIRDMGYMKIALDAKSMASVKANLPKFKSGMRSKLWQHLWDDVLDQRMSLSEFLQLLDGSLVSSDAADVAATSSKMISMRDYFWQMRDDNNKFDKELTNLEKISWRELQQAQAGSDIQKIWFDSYVQLAYTSTALNRLANYLSGKQKVSGLVFDQDRRWLTLVRLNLFNHKNAKALTEKEKKKDTSDPGQQMALVSEAVRPDVSIKQEFFEKLIAKDQAYKLATSRLLMMNMLPTAQPEYRSQYFDSILSNIPKLHQERESKFVEIYLNKMLPRLCYSTSVQCLSAASDEYSQLSPVINRALKIAVQESQRCVDMKKLVVK